PLTAGHGLLEIVTAVSFAAVPGSSISRACARPCASGTLPAPASVTASGWPGRLPFESSPARPDPLLAPPASDLASIYPGASRVEKSSPTKGRKSVHGLKHMTDVRPIMLDCNKVTSLAVPMVRRASAISPPTEAIRGISGGL